MVFEVVEHTKLYISTKKIVIGGGGGTPTKILPVPDGG